MTNSEASLSKPAAPTNRLPIAFLVTSAIGFMDAAYLTTQHFLGAPIACSILKGCEQVTTSQFSMLGQIPVALLGAIYYLTILVLSVVYLDSRRESALKIASCLTIIGLLASVRFVYLQLFVIKAICLYCMGSATTSTVLFILGMIYLAKHSQKSPSS